MKIFLFLLPIFFFGCSKVTPIDKVIHNPERGKFQIGVREFEWSDHERKRIIKVAVWYPTPESSEEIKYLAFKGHAKKDATVTKDHFPLILVSHGTGGHRYNQFYISEFLASFGYIVAAIEHPHNNAFDNKDQGTVSNLWHRPKDVSFVLDRLLNSQIISSHIKHEEIGFIGHSIGGYTGFVIAGAIPNFRLLIDYCQDHPEDHLMCQKAQVEQGLHTNYTFDFSKLRDQRVKALLVMAPALGQAFERRDMEKVDIPILLIASGQDEVLIKPYNILRYLKALPKDIQYVEFPKAGHYVYLHECPFIVGMIAGEACKDVGVSRSEIHPKLKKLCLEFFNSHLNSLN